ncbi:MAG: flagellar basal body L-ring protein FlgH [Myxococcota bacterium]|nr:flagellar basal body L-ring protein FlgH [Myxococcales bacterium]
MSPSEPAIRQRAQRVLAALALVLSTGCVEHSIREGREPMDYDGFEQPPAPPPSEGSIWRGSTQSGSFLFFDEKASRVGDLVTVVIVEQTDAQGDARTETRGERTIDASLSSQVGFQKLITSPVRGLLRIFGFDNPGVTQAEGAGVNFVQSDVTNDFTGEGLTSRSGTFTGVITCRVIGVLPNGILHIRGRRSVVVNHEAQYISLEGLVRREDLTIENQVLSNSVAEMRLAYDGMGVVDDKQRPGWMARVIDWVYPF